MKSVLYLKFIKLQVQNVKNKFKFSSISYKYKYIVVAFS